MKFVNNKIKIKLSNLKKIKKDFDKRRKKSSKFSEKIVITNQINIFSAKNIYIFLNMK